MKHLKTKLFASVITLAISVVMVASASFAWFTLSTNPEVDTITATSKANENLEIKDGDEDWGNIVSAGATGILRPAAYASGAWTAPSYGEDGRIISETGVTISEDGGKLVGSDHLQYGFYFDIQLRTNLADNLLVSLTDKADRSADGVTGDGSYVVCEDSAVIQGAISVVFRIGDDGYSAEATNTAGKLTGTVGSLTGVNEATPVRVYVFLNELDNEDAPQDYTATITLQFTNGAEHSMDEPDAA